MLLRQAPLAGAFSVFMAMAAPAHALDWKIEPSVSATATYTDNAKQSDTDPKDALILSVNPSVSFRSEGSRRVQASLQYGLRGVTRFGDDNSNDLNHNLNAVGKAELVEDFLFIDGSARVSQELISLFGSPAEADINSSNRATVGTYSISPYIQKRLGTFANAQARYTASGAIFENDVASNSNVNAFTAGLTSGTQFNDLSWGLNYSIRKANNKNDGDTTFERASAQLGYALTRKFRVFGTVGQDWNDYISANKIDGSSYSVGFGWAPTRRTSVEASVGERYFGRTYSLAANHRTRLSRWTVRYYEDVSDITQHHLAQSGRQYWKCSEAGLNQYILAIDPTQPPASNCEGPYAPFELINLASSAELEELVTNLALRQDIGIGSTKGVFLIKGLTAGVSWNVGKLGLGFSAHDTKRLYQALNDAEDHVRGLTGTVSYRLSPQTTANSSLSFTRTSADALLSPGGVLPRDDDLLSLSLGLNHRFAEDLSGTVTLRHTQRDSNAADSDYQENRITGTVNMRF